MDGGRGDGWALVVPVRGGTLGKSRLALPNRDRLADAFARDTVAALRAGMPSALVLVVTSDPDVAGWAGRAGCAVVADPGTGLDSAGAVGTSAALTDPRVSWVAVVLADHPALRADELPRVAAALGGVTSGFVPDAEGTGTAVLVTSRAGTYRSAFGPGSAARHQSLGHPRLDLDLPGLRTDVDDTDSLAAALALGVGPRTTLALAAATGSLVTVQATIYAMEAGEGSALLDDGLEVEVPAEALIGSGLRFLRPGQRVSIELDESGTRATRVWIVGIGNGEVVG